MYWKDRAIEPWYSDSNWQEFRSFETLNRFSSPYVDRPSFSIDLYNGDDKLQTYDSIVFWYNYSVWETQLRYADPNNPSNTGTYFIQSSSGGSVNHARYHGQFMSFTICLPRYYKYGSKFYDILKLQPKICSKSDLQISFSDSSTNLSKVVNFASNPLYKCPYNETCKSYLLSSPDKQSGNDLIVSQSNYIDGVANYYSAGSHTIQSSPVSYIYFDMPYVNYHAYLVDDNDDLDFYFREVFDNQGLKVSDYVFLDFIFGAPYLVPFGLSNYQTTDFEQIQYLMVNQLYDFMHWNTENGQDYTYLPPLIDVSDASVIENYLGNSQAPCIDIFDYYYSPYINLYIKMGLYISSVIQYNAGQFGFNAAELSRIVDYRFLDGEIFYRNSDGFAASSDDIDVWFETDLQLSDAEVTNAELVNALSDVQMSVDNQTEFLRSPSSANTAAVNSLTSDFQNSAGKLNNVTDSTDLSGFQADDDFVNNNVDVLLNGIDSGLIGTAFSFVNHNSGVILTLMTISISCVVLGYVVFGKKS